MTDNIQSLLKRVELFLEEEDFDSASEYCERILDIDPENSRAYVFRLLIEHKCISITELEKSDQLLDDSINYKRALQYGDDKLINKLAIINNNIKENNINVEKNRIYNNAKKEIQNKHYSLAIDYLSSILPFKNSDDLIEECNYKAAVEKINQCTKVDEVNIVIDTSKGLIDTRFQSQLKDRAESKIKEIKIQQKINDEKNRRFVRNKKIAIKVIIIAAVSIVVFLSGLFLYVNIIKPNIIYSNALTLEQEGKYLEAKDNFSNSSIGDYLDHIKYCNNMIADQGVNSSCNVGDRFYYGLIEQNGLSEDGPEPIEWEIIDKKGSQVLVLSTKIINYMQAFTGIPAADPIGSTSNDVNWENSNIRNWLNNTFYFESFSQEQQQKILGKENLNSKVYDIVSNGSNGAAYLKTETSTTFDKIFCLSFEECEAYSKDKPKQVTEYASDLYKKSGAKNVDRIQSWVLRTLHNTINECWPKIFYNIYIVDKSSNKVEVHNNGAQNWDNFWFGVCPAMWINIS